MPNRVHTSGQYFGDNLNFSLTPQERETVAHENTHASRSNKIKSNRARTPGNKYKLHISSPPIAKKRTILYYLYMEINLNSQQIYLINNPTTKQELVKYLVTNICANTALNQEEVFKAIIKREQGISTTLESGLSIPHARIEGLTSFKAVMAVIPQKVQDDYGKNIKVMFLFLSPSGEQYFPEHLKLLAKLAETFTRAFIKELCTLKTTEEIAAKLPF